MAEIIVAGTGVAIAVVMVRVIITGAGGAVVAALTVVKLEVSVVTGVDVMTLVTDDEMVMVSPGATLAVMISWIMTHGSKVVVGCCAMSANRFCENPGTVSASS